jgi:MFS family permease
MGCGARHAPRPVASRVVTDAQTADGVLGPRLRWTTIGLCSLILFVAFEAMAVTTVMPVIARQLDGTSLYTLAFAGSTAVSVVGMVLSGEWCDRHGPTLPLLLSTVLFMAGLAIAGLAPTMVVLVVGRLVQGIGGGGLIVAVYVLVARSYPPRLHPVIFVGFSTAWVVPSLVGPFVAGVLAQTVGWRWIFLAVIVMAAAGLVMVRSVGPRSTGHPAAARRRAGERSGLVGSGDADTGTGVREAGTDVAIDAAGSPESTPWKFSRLIWAVLLAAAVLVLSAASDFTPVWRWTASVAAAIVLVVALRPLMPKGMLRAARGLPSVLGARILLAAAQFSAEVYVPYLLVDHFAFAPSIAGLALTGGAISWSGGSWLQGKLGTSAIGARISNRRWIVTGMVFVCLGIAGTALVCALSSGAGSISPYAIFGIWVFAGLGMGIATPRLSVMMLAYSIPADQGFNSSAQSIADSAGGAIGVATVGLAFTSLSGIGTTDAAGTAGSTLPYTICFVIGTVFALAAVVVATRVGRVPASAR